MKKISPSEILDSLRNNIKPSEDYLIKFLEQENSVDLLLDIYSILEKADNREALKLRALMEKTIGEKYIEKYGIVPREAMALGLLEKTIGLELLNDDDYPSLPHVHAVFRIKNGHIYDIDIVEVECSKVKFINLLPNLEMLTIYIAGLKEIEGLESLSKLKLLDLAVNELTCIKGLENLSKLKKLYLYRNKITQLDGLESLVDLEELLIHENPIKELKGIEKLKNLKHLEFDETNLTVKEIKKIKKKN